MNGRAPNGYFLPGHAMPGPGRPRKTVAEFLLDAARELAQPMEAARSAVEIARELSPAALLRTAEILQDPATENRDALDAARLILERGWGMPSQAVATLNLDATVITPEQREQDEAHRAAALSRLLALARPPQEPSSG